MDRQNLQRRILLFLAIGAWTFLLLALASFHAEDWPSHQVYPYPPTHNLCGPVGSYLAYHLFFAIGQGVFPIVFFSGLCLALMFFHNRISDPWLRGIGLAILSIAFASMIHLIRPGSHESFPEGDGGIIGISASTFLKAHFSTGGTSLILITSFLVGLLLAADDLVIRAPGLITQAVQQVKERTPALANFKFPAMPKLPALPFFVTREAAAAKSSRTSSGNREEDDDTPLKGPAVLRQNFINMGERVPLENTVNGQPIELTYEHDEPALAATETAFATDADHPPSEAAVIPPPEQQVVVQAPKPQAVINRPTQPAAPINSAGIAQKAAGIGLPQNPAGPTVPLPAPLRTIADPDAQGEADLADAPAPDHATVSLDENGFVTSAGGIAEEDDGLIDPIVPPSAHIPTGVAETDPGSPEQRKEIIVRGAATQKPKVPAAPPPPKELGDYHLPTWDVLNDPEHGFSEQQEAYVREKAAALEQAFKEFNIEALVTEIDTGPVITMYEISIPPGTKVSQITQLQNDIARSLAAVSVRIVAPVPGKSTVGIEVPNPVKEKVRLKELMALAPEATRKMQIPLYLGKDASGEPLVTDMTKMPHCLIAGTTGSGKSVCINTIIMSVMYTQRPDMVKMILVDPKVVEMAPFKDIPHLMCPVINDCGRATSVLEWACEKMDERYEILAEAGVRNLEGYNKLTRDELIERFKPGSPEEEAKIPKFLPYIIIIIDELADLMMTSGKEVESSIVRLAQKSRAVGIHLILATQRPSANVVTGLIKANMPSRIAFRVNSRMDSRIVLDQNGADLLLGQGDMLFLPPGLAKPIRSQGTFIDDKEIKESVKLVKAQAEAQYEPELVQIKAKFNQEDMMQDDLFDDAVKVVLETKRGSVSLLQRRLTIGYGRAARLIEMMAAAGIVGEYKGTQSREATITLEEWEAMKQQKAQDAEDGMTV